MELLRLFETDIENWLEESELGAMPPLDDKIIK